MRRTDAMRERVEMLGFRDLDDETVEALAPWLRLPPAITLILLVTGTLLHSAPIVLSLVPFALVCVISGAHPFDTFYNFGLRFVVDGPRLPAHGTPRRFACAVASVWLLATGCAFAAGAVVTGATLGWVMAAVATLPSTTGFCVPAWAYTVLTGRGRRGQSCCSENGHQNCHPEAPERSEGRRRIS